MKPIKKDELFQNLSGFLKAKGIDLKPGSYTQRIRRGCGLLSDTINLTQDGLQRAKVEIDTKLEQMRQVIRKRSPFKSPAGAKPAGSAPPKSATGAAGKPKRASGSRKKTGGRTRAT
jgi:hypothetical protein